MGPDPILTYNVSRISLSICVVALGDRMEINMKKQRLYYILSAACFLLMLALTFALIGNIYAALDTNSKNNANSAEGGFASFGAALGLAIVLVLLYVYAITLAGPSLIKIIQACVLKRGLGIVGTVFDGIFAIFNTVLLISSLTDGDIRFDITLLWLIAVVILPIAALCFDIIALKKKTAVRENDTEEISEI